MNYIWSPYLAVFSCPYAACILSLQGLSEESVYFLFILWVDITTIVCHLIAAPSPGASPRAPPSSEATDASNPASERSSRHSLQPQTHMAVSSFSPHSDQPSLLMCQSNCCSWCLVPHHCDCANSISPIPVRNRVESVSIPILETLVLFQEGYKISRAAVKEQEVYY